MKKLYNRIKPVTWVPIFAIACLVAVQSTRAAEPVYEGKAFSEWLAALHADFSDEETVAATKQNMEPVKVREQKQNHAREAIRQIGTNGLPVLLDLVGAGEDNRRSVARRIKSREIKNSLRDSDPEFREAVRELAMDGFVMLGTNAEPAIPQLTKLLREESECQLDVAYALAQIGPKGFAVLTNAINDEDLAGILVLAIGQKGGGDLQTVTRLLISALKSPNPIIRGNAADFLSGKDATLAVPALIPMLDDEYYPRHLAAHSLGVFGPAAKIAVPKLLSLYTNHPDIFVMGALKAIDREAAGRAEEFLVNSGPLNGARKGYTRTKLTNGMELITGGHIDTAIIIITNRYLSTAQLFDPQTGKWTETGRMTTPRVYHAAALLHDGKVLVAGGSDKHFHDVSSAELYDPATGTWTEMGSMKKARSSCHVLVQSNGKILVFSGGGSLNSPAFDKELYDPATGTWKMIPDEPAFDKALYDYRNDMWKLPPHHKDYE